jgi:hypothetical protein
MDKSSHIAWKIVPLRYFFPLKVVPLIEVLLQIDIVTLYQIMLIVNIVNTGELQRDKKSTDDLPA